MGQYKVIKSIGSGTLGLVYHVEDSAGRSFAMKVLKLDNASFSNFEGDIAIANHGALNHPHIVRCRDSFRNNDSLCIIMDLANSGSLFDLVRQYKRLSENYARWFFQQLIFAVDYCHKCGVDNCNIKLENLLLHTDVGQQQPILKMCDFGYNKAYRRSTGKAEVVTPSYMAPEMLSIVLRKQYDPKLTDVWSCGVVLYILLYGSYPFDHYVEDKDISESEKMRLMFERMTRLELRLFQDVPLSVEAIGMLYALLQPHPENRLRVADIIAHPWFKQNLPPRAMVMQDWYVQQNSCL